MQKSTLRLLHRSKKEEKKYLEAVPELAPPLPVFGFFWKVMGPLKPWMYATLFFVVLAEALEVSMSYLTKQTVDIVTIAGTDTVTYAPQMFFWVGLTLISGLIANLSWRCSGYFASHYINFMNGRMELSLFRYLAQHNPGYFYDHFAGALANKVRNICLGYHELNESFQWMVVGAGVQFIGAFVLIFSVSPILTGLAILWAVLFLTFFRTIGKKKKAYSTHRAEEQSRRTGRVVDSITNMLNVTLFARRKEEQTHLRTYVYNSLDAGRASWRYTELMNLIASFLTITMRSLMVLYTVYLWMEGQATAGDISMVFMLTFALSQSLRDIGKVMNNWYKSLGSIQEGLDTILIPHGIVDLPNAQPLKVTKGAISFENVTFSYPDRDPVLEEFSLSIKPGEKVGLVGRSGAGKTTLMSLLLRFYELNSGTISIDGQDLTQITQQSLREEVAMVPQESMLFHRSIIENIRYGRKNATDEEVYAAAKLAMAHDFITILPEGYNTLVGERGVKLSGGQRQRVAIARAILKNAPVLVLDEATASLDSESEVAISDALHNLVQDKTVIAIAHRLSTLREMTRIIVMDGGKIVEDGSHEELLEKGGLYATLWQTQAGGFIQE